jgi:hypothetical protein
LCNANDALQREQAQYGLVNPDHVATNKGTSMFVKTLSIAGLLSVGLLSAPVSAAPGNLKGADVEAGTTAAEQVHRRCWRHRGHWHCRGHRAYRSYGYYPGYYGYRPGVSLYFGGHRHRHWGHRHRHW